MPPQPSRPYSVPSKNPLPRRLHLRRLGFGVDGHTKAVASRPQSESGYAAGALYARLDAAGSVYCLGAGYAGNGNVLAANDLVSGNWTYGYDGLNRLQTALTTGQNFTYNPDPWSNMNRALERVPGICEKIEFSPLINCITY